MSYRFLEHTADLKIKLEGSNLIELFESGVESILSFLNPVKDNRGHVALRTVNITSPDKTALLVDFLGEVVRLALSNKESYDKVVFDELSNTALKAELYGEKVNGFSDDIKAVTYHGAHIRQNPDGRWETEIICDI